MHSHKQKIKIKGDSVKFNDLFFWGGKFSCGNGYKSRELDGTLLLELTLEYRKETEFAEFSSLKRTHNINWSDIESNVKINSKR